MRHILIFCMLCILLAACRQDEYVDFSEEQTTGGIPEPEGSFCGMYLLNEGNMGSNHCTLDYLDFGSATYHRNIYGQRNPSLVKELGDVGNDLQRYGSRLWMVINGSNKVEVADVATACRLGQVEIPNGRYLAFDGGYAYISSYVGPIALSGDAQLGRIYKVDTLSLQKVDSVVVGYQPEEMAIVDGRLYVANSGGYRAPEYDNRISVIDLSRFADAPRHYTVDINLHRLRADRYGQLWVSSRGDYHRQQGALYCLAADAGGRLTVSGRLDIPVSDMQLVGDTLWYLASDWDQADARPRARYGLIDVLSRNDLQTSLFDAPEAQQMETPYGLLVNPLTRDFYLMDAHNYVSSGRLLHFSPSGTFEWSVRTGDIPSRGLLIERGAPLPPTATSPLGNDTVTVIDYSPAPGQFVNLLPLYEAGDDRQRMAQKCSEALNRGGMVCLGGFGGSLTFRFDHPIGNHPGYDFCIFGNSIEGNSEPGIVEVASDSNGNGLPDDPWYELAGSAESDHLGPIRYGYSIEYASHPMGDIPWCDSEGATGYVRRNSFHTQEYFPLWLDAPLRYSGTRLPDNGTDLSDTGSRWHLQAFGYGYVDNLPGRDPASAGFDLDWAVDPATREPVALQRVHFVRVYTALNQQCGWLGETSTEISGACILYSDQTNH